MWEPYPSPTLIEKTPTPSPSSSVSSFFSASFQHDYRKTKFDCCRLQKSDVSSKYVIYIYGTPMELLIPASTSSRKISLLTSTKNMSFILVWNLVILQSLPFHTSHRNSTPKHNRHLKWPSSWQWVYDSSIRVSTRPPGGGKDGDENTLMKEYMI